MAEGGLETHCTPGDHWTHVNLHSKGLAERIRACLEQAEAADSRRLARAENLGMKWPHNSPRAVIPPRADSSLWLPPLKPRKDASLRLICFPYAGAGMPAFHAWPAALPETIELRVVQLPGRGARLRERRFEQMPPLIEALDTALLPLLDRPFAFFGHSLGSIVAFEAARKLRARGLSPLICSFPATSLRTSPTRRRPSISCLPTPFSANSSA